MNVIVLFFCTHTLCHVFDEGIIWPPPLPAQDLSQGARTGYRKFFLICFLRSCMCPCHVIFYSRHVIYSNIHFIFLYTYPIPFSCIHIPNCISHQTYPQTHILKQYQYRVMPSHIHLIQVLHTQVEFSLHFM